MYISEEEEELRDRDRPSSPVMSPMSANIDDISPFTIMSAQADEIALSNVDTTSTTQSSKAAWGDKSNSPKEKSLTDKLALLTTPEKSPAQKAIPAEKPVTKTVDKPTPKSPDKTYAFSTKDTPINLCACCLCCFRIQSLEELPSLYKHIKSQHNTARTCVLCSITYKDVYALMLHVAEFHRAAHVFRCVTCGSRFDYHAELAKHTDMCFMSDVSSEEGSPVKKRFKRGDSAAGAVIPPELVSTLNKTQDTLNKINEFISGGFESS